MLMSIGKFAKKIGVSVSTVRHWDNINFLKPVKISNTGYRYYSQEQVDKYLDNDNKNDKVILYGRVSTQGQKDDLERQIQNLKTYAYSKGYSFEVITDIGSGINYKNKGLIKLLELISHNQINRVVILYKDRLVRFGFEIIEKLCELHNVTLEIVDNTETSKEQELTDDLIQIITVFANRLYGRRHKKTLSLIKQVKDNDIK